MQWEDDTKETGPEVHRKTLLGHSKKTSWWLEAPRSTIILPACLLYSEEETWAISYHYLCLDVSKRWNLFQRVCLKRYYYKEICWILGLISVLATLLSMYQSPLLPSGLLPGNISTRPTYYNTSSMILSLWLMLRQSVPLHTCPGPFILSY